MGSALRRGRSAHNGLWCDCGRCRREDRGRHASVPQGTSAYGSGQGHPGAGLLGDPQAAAFPSQPAGHACRRCPGDRPGQPAAGEPVRCLAMSGEVLSLACGPLRVPEPLRRYAAANPFQDGAEGPDPDGDRQAPGRSHIGTGHAAHPAHTGYGPAPGRDPPSQAAGREGPPFGPEWQGRRALRPDLPSGENPGWWTTSRRTRACGWAGGVR